MNKETLVMTKVKQQYNIFTKSNLFCWQTKITTINGLQKNIKRQRLYKFNKCMIRENIEIMAQCLSMFQIIRNFRKIKILIITL